MKPCLSGPLITGKWEIERMKRLVPALPLYDRFLEVHSYMSKLPAKATVEGGNIDVSPSINTPPMTFSQCTGLVRAVLERISDGKTPPFVIKAHPTIISITRRLLNQVHRGAPMAIRHLDQAMADISEQLPVIENTARTIYPGVYLSGMSPSEIIAMADALKTRPDLDPDSKDLKSAIMDTSKGVAMFIQSIFATLSVNSEQLGMFEDINKIGASRIRMFKELSDAIDKTPKGPKRNSLLRRRYRNCYFNTWLGFRFQTMPVPERRVAVKPASPDEWQAPLQVSSAERRTQYEDRCHIKQNYPNLYRRMMKPDKPTAREMAARAEKKALKKLVRELSNKGVTMEMIKDCIREGRNPRELLMEHGKEVEVVGSAPAREYKRILRGRKSREEDDSECDGKHTETKSRPHKSIDKFLRTIKFDKDVESFIRNHGLEPWVLVFTLYKGFGFGKTKSAMGAAHFRGTIIKSNISRVLERNCPERRELTADSVLSFLRSIDLVKDFGSSASVRTKDKAMSINTSPSNEIGQKILDTFNAAFYNGCLGTYRKRAPCAEKSDP